MARRKRGRTLDERAAASLKNDNPTGDFVTLDRREICRLEINAAIRLFLIDEDPIAAHLLASAASEIIEVLSEGQEGIGLNSLRAALKKAGVISDEQEELFQTLLHPYNFLKHSSSDKTARNKFDVEVTVLTLYTAIHGYKALFSDFSPEMRVFYGMVMSWRSHWWEGDPDFDFETASKLKLAGLTRQEFCEVGRNLLQKVQASWPT